MVGKHGSTKPGGRRIGPGLCNALQRKQLVESEEGESMVAQISLQSPGTVECSGC
jgi:hypothetical protein